MHIQLNLDNNKVVVINTTRSSYLNLTATLDVYDLVGQNVLTLKSKINSTGNELTTAFDAEFPSTFDKIYLVRLTLKNSQGMIISQNDYWKTFNQSKTFKEFNLLGTPILKSSLSMPAISDKRHFKFKVTNTSAIPAISIKFNLRDSSNGELLLPAYFSEGSVNLMPGETKEITCTGPHANTRMEVICQGYNLRQIKLLSIN